MSVVQESGALNLLAGESAGRAVSGADGGVITRVHLRRLRDVYRSAGWPCCDGVEIELLAAGLLTRVRSGDEHETLRVTDTGIAQLAVQLSFNRAVRSRHEALVEKVARDMLRAGRIVWRELSLRAHLPAAAPGEKGRWCIARPDVFSIRNTSVEAYAEPVVHEVKVNRSDLLGDLRKADKRAAYLDLGGECWYVLGRDAKGRPIASPDEIPAGCGVLVEDGAGLIVARPAAHRALPRLPFGVWMALAKAQSMAGFDDEAQALLGPSGTLPGADAGAESPAAKAHTAVLGENPKFSTQRADLAVPEGARNNCNKR